jgi:Phosphoesterase family
MPAPVRMSALLGSVALGALAFAAPVCAADLTKITNIVVIYAENRSFDNLYGHFPGANGLDNISADQARQLDRDGTPLPTRRPFGTASPPRASHRLSLRCKQATCPTASSLSTIPRASTCRSASPRATWCTASIRSKCRSTAARMTSSRRGATRAASSWAPMMARNCRCGRSRRSTCWPTISSTAPSAARSSTTSSWSARARRFTPMPRRS